MSDNLQIVVVPKELYYHEVAYVRGLENRIEALEAALRDAERFISYLANETDGRFVGPGTPTTCLVMIRAALSSPDVAAKAPEPNLALELEAFSRSLAGKPWTPWGVDARILLEKAASALPGAVPSSPLQDAYDIATARIEQLEARLDRAVTRGLEQVERIAALEAALRDVIRDIDEYERVNKLAPSPGKTECWQSVANARAALAPEQDK